MKKLINLFAVLIAISFSCTKEIGDSKDIRATQEEMKTYQAKIRLSIASNLTKAPGDVYDAGDNSEFEINSSSNSFIIFYSAEKLPISVQQLWNAEWTTAQVDNNVANVGTLEFISGQKPKYMVCLLNINDKLANEYNEDVLSSLSLDKLKAFTSKALNYGGKENIKSHFASKDGFFMSNSSFVKGNTIVQEVELTDNQVVEVKENEKANPSAIDIFVERAVAKVTVENKIFLKKVSDYYVINSFSGHFGLRILGWGLNATNKSFSPLKNLDINNINSNIEAFKTFANSSESVVNWFSQDSHRSFWAVDDNYTTDNATDYLTNSMFVGRDIPTKANLALNYYSLNEIAEDNFKTNSAANAEYCFENTVAFDNNMQDKFNSVTHIIVKAQYIDLITGNTVNNVYKVDNKIFKEDTLKAFIKEKLETLTKLTINTNNISITRSNAEYKDRKDVKGVISYSGNLGEYDSRKTNLNDIVLGVGMDCWVYPKGICYYVIPIYQFLITKELLLKSPSSDRGFEGFIYNNTYYYGVVRNHWYNVNINHIYDFGEPADPDKPITPETIKYKEWAMNASVNVLSWSVVNQDAALGGEPDGLIIFNPDFNPDFNPVF